jgi:hypothetical protein
MNDPVIVVDNDRVRYIPGNIIYAYKNKDPVRLSFYYLVKPFQYTEADVPGYSPVARMRFTEQFHPVRVRCNAIPKKNDIRIRMLIASKLFGPYGVVGGSESAIPFYLLSQSGQRDPG